MHHKGRFPNEFFGTHLRPDSAAIAIMVLLLFLILIFLFMTLTAPPAQAQTLKVMHNFTGGADGFDPMSGLTMDRAGNLYGTTAGWGVGGNDCTRGTVCGTVFKVSPSGVLNTVHRFAGGSDGEEPYGRVIFGPDGNLYGTTKYGGGCMWSGGCGTIFKLTPPATVSPTAVRAWTKTVLYQFSASDGAYPTGELVFDSHGNIYGTTVAGGSSGGGTVYKLAHSPDGWTETILYSFTGGSDGGAPLGGVVFDDAGRLYGTTYVGGDLTCLPSQGCGTVFRIGPSPTGWRQNVLHTFHGGNDGGRPGGTLVFDNSGKLCGGTDGQEPYADGTIFTLSPSDGGWIYEVLHNFGDGYMPGTRSLTLDPIGNLYGARWSDTYPYGMVFKLTRDGSGWTYTRLYDFTGGLDGGGPSNVILDSHGNIYGSAREGGDPQWCGGYGGCGVVWEITP